MNDLAPPCLAEPPPGRLSGLVVGAALDDPAQFHGRVAQGSGTAGFGRQPAQLLAEGDVVWLPPLEPGTIVALGLNCADHASELTRGLPVPADAEPLVFFKPAGALLGHRGQTWRPRQAKFMHYECELAVVIGKPGRRIAAAAAMAHVAGYTVANDCALRDPLENRLRPSLQAKNRDGATALGPWLVPAAEVVDPHALALSTHVNGVLTQSGHTSNRVHRIPALIESLSSFMSLAPGGRHPHRHARRRGQRQRRRPGGVRHREHRRLARHAGRRPRLRR